MAVTAPAGLRDQLRSHYEQRVATRPPLPDLSDSDPWERYIATLGAAARAVDVRLVEDLCAGRPVVLSGAVLRAFVDVDHRGSFRVERDGRVVEVDTRRELVTPA